MAVNSNLRRIIAIIIIGIIAYQLDYRQLLSAFSQVGWLVVALGLGMEYLFYLIETTRLHLLFAGAYSYPSLLRTRLVSVLVGAVLPGSISAEIFRGLSLNAVRHLGLVKILSILAANRLYGAGGLALFSSALMLYSPREFPGEILAASLVATVLVLLLPFLVRGRGLRKFLLPLLRALPLGRRFFTMAYLVVRRHTSLKVWMAVIASSALSIAVVMLQLRLLGQALGVELSAVNWGIIAVFCGMAGFLPLGIGAIGPQDFSLVMIAHWLDQPVEAFVVISLLLHALRLGACLPAAVYMGEALKLKTSLR